jgi:ferredoxin
MKVRIDGHRCSGHGRCYTVAATVFRADADGYNAHLDVVLEVAPGDEEAAELGMESCPEHAITLIEEG